MRGTTHVPRYATSETLPRFAWFIRCSKFSSHLFFWKVPFIVFSCSAIVAVSKALLHFYFLYCDISIHFWHLLLFNTTASPRLKPEQLDQEEQRTRVAYGETDPDLSAC